MTSVVYLVIGCVFAFAFYRESERTKKANGVTPWHWPSWLWASVGFLFGLLGLILLLIARRKPKPAPPLGVAAYAPELSLRGGSTPPGAPSPAPTVGPSWQRDPTGRYATRYWDGSSWTEFVSDGTSTTSDPLSV